MNPPGNGTTFAIRPDKELDIVAENTLGERVFASSTINQSSIHFKGAQHLYAIGKKPKLAAKLLLPMGNKAVLA